jgi:hypothetical protein
MPITLYQQHVKNRTYSLPIRILLRLIVSLVGIPVLLVALVLPIAVAPGDPDMDPWWGMPFAAVLIIIGVTIFAVGFTAARKKH